MIQVEMPDAEGVADVVRSMAACLASATETPISEVPQPTGELPTALAAWRSWLAGHGAGLIALARPATFNWPGYWLAVVGQVGASAPAGLTAVLMFGSPSGVVLSPQQPALLGTAATALPIRQGYVIAGLDPAFVGARRPRPRLRGEVTVVAIARRATGSMLRVEHARALAGRGLEGDRYAAQAGTFSPRGGTGSGYDLTLIEAEALDDLRLPDGGELGYTEARRNLVTRGIDLNALVGRRFRVGDVECIGRRLCEPCAHLEDLTAAGVLRGLIHRAGLRADVLTSGRIREGDPIATVD